MADGRHRVGVEHGGGEYIKDQAGWCKRSHGMAGEWRNNGRGELSEDTGCWISIVSHRTRFSQIVRKTKQPSILQQPPPHSDEWDVSQFEIRVEPSHKRIPNKTRLHSLSPFSFLSRSHVRPSLPRLLCHLELAHSLPSSTTMFTSHVVQPSRDAAYEETSTQLAIYSRTLFQFTLRLWSESRKRAEELQKIEEAAFSRPSQVRTGSVRSIREVDANSPQ